MNTKTNKFTFIDKPNYIKIRETVFINCPKCHKKFFVDSSKVSEAGIVSNGPDFPTTICPNCHYESCLWLQGYLEDKIDKADKRE